MTYLNKGQFYPITLKEISGGEGIHQPISKVRVSYNYRNCVAICLGVMYYFRAQQAYIINWCSHGQFLVANLMPAGCRRNSVLHYPWSDQQLNPHVS